jgi:DME family drug/metabolite transporter
LATPALLFLDLSSCFCQHTPEKDLRKKGETLIGELSALGCAFCWSLSSTLTKSLSGKFEPRTLNLLRCLAASIFLWGIISFSPGINALGQAPGDSLIYLILSALIGIALGDTIYIRGLKLINITVAFPIAQSAMPLFTLGAAVLFLGETITRALLLGTTLVLAGVYLIAGPGKRNRFPGPVPTAEKKGMGIGLILLASLLWAISISLLKVGLQGVSLILANGVRLPVASLALIFLILFQKSRQQPSRLHIRDVMVAAVSGILSFGIGGLLFLQAILYSGAAKATVLTSAAPLFGLPLSLVLLKERVTTRIAVGTVLVVLGIGFIVAKV